MFLKSSIGILLICCSASLALITFGSCPRKTDVQNFNLQMFSGFWYEIRALENIHLTQEGWGSCVTILFDSTSIRNATVADRNILNDLIPGGGSNSQNYTRETSTLSTVVFGRNHTGTINADFVTNSSRFKIHGTWRFLSIPSKTIQILETDYTNWALLWSCQDMGLISKQNAWVLTRAPNVTATLSSTIINSIFAQGLPEADFRVTEQSNCVGRSNQKPFFSPLAFSQVN